MADYPFIATVRGHHFDVPVRRVDGAWWCKYEVDYGIVWGSRDVTDVRPHPGPCADVHCDRPASQGINVAGRLVGVCRIHVRDNADVELPAEALA